MIFLGLSKMRRFIVPCLVMFCNPPLAFLLTFISLVLVLDATLLLWHDLRVYGLSCVDAHDLTRLGSWLPFSHCTPMPLVGQLSVSSLGKFGTSLGDSAQIWHFPRLALLRNKRMKGRVRVNL